MSAAAASRLRPIVLCGPSGVGKSTLIARLRAEFPASFGFSVSHTTRAPRAGERDGVDYNFTTRDVMQAGIADGAFLESADVHGNFYGTSFKAVETVAADGRCCILDIDVQGVASCRKAGFDVGAYIFVGPPEVAELEARLRKRATEGEGASLAPTAPSFLTLTRTRLPPIPLSFPLAPRRGEDCEARGGRIGGDQQGVRHVVGRVDYQ